MVGGGIEGHYGRPGLVHPGAGRAAGTRGDYTRIQQAGRDLNTALDDNRRNYGGIVSIAAVVVVVLLGVQPVLD